MILFYNFIILRFRGCFDVILIVDKEEIVGRKRKYGVLYNKIEVFKLGVIFIIFIEILMVRISYMVIFRRKGIRRCSFE